MDDMHPELRDRPEPIASEQDSEGLLLTIQEWVRADMAHSSSWRANAKKEFSFVAGGQWDEADVQKLKDEQRPVVTFNKTLKFVRAICGLEANNRQMTTFLPRDVANPGEVKVNELLTNASDWMDQGCKASKQQSRAFRDATICGMGWTESAIDYDVDPAGMYVETRCNPLEMGWDCNARDQNLQDSKRRWRVRKMTLEEAHQLIPGVTDAEGILASDLDASWAADVLDAGPATTKTQEQKELREENTSAAAHPKREVHIVQIQWWEHEKYIRTVDVMTGKPKDVALEQFSVLERTMADTFGITMPKAEMRRKVYKQAFVGGKVLKVGPCPRADGFTFHPITWEPDDNEGTWFGLARSIHDPQEWENKFFAQLMHIVNSTAKGGVLAESDAFEDVRQAQKDYAKPQAITVVRPGAITKGKIMPKPGAGVTSGVLSLLEITSTMFAETTGMNLELMGLADRQQAGVLEAQRKQAAMTILATLFDSLSSFRQDVGQTRLYFIQNYLADGRLIRIHGNDGYTAIPLVQDKTLGRYDVIVDDAPSSTNMKEKAWAALSMVLPVFKDMLTPEVAVMLLDYVPHLPSRLIEGLKAIASQGPDPEAQQLAIRGQTAEVAKTEGAALQSKSAAVLNMARAASEKAKADAEAMDNELIEMGLLQPAGARRPRPRADDAEIITGPQPMPRQAPAGAEPQPQAPELAGLALPGGLTNGGLT